MRNRMFLSSPHKATPQLGMPRHQAGFSLVELMIAITLGLIVLLAIGSIYIGSQQTYRVQEDNARIQEAGRYALEVLGRSIRQAGANAEMNFNKTATALQCNVPGVCNAIGGVDGATTDTLTVQFYAGSEELNTSSGLWVARDCTGRKAALGAVVDNTFDITGVTNLNLRCTARLNGVLPLAATLVENVQDLQVVYGIDTDSSGNPNYQSADLYVAAPTAAQLPNVVSARVCVQINSANNGLTPSPQKFLNCAGALGTATGAAAFTTAAAGDLRLHRSFVATYNLRNRVAAAP